MAFELDHFKKTLVYEVTGDFTTLRADLASLRELDKIHEGHKRTAWKLIGFGILMLIGGGVVNGGFQLRAVGLGMAGLGAVMLVTGIVLNIIHGPLDLDDARYEIVERLYSMLEADTAPNGQVVARIDFRKHDHKSKLLRTDKVGTWNVNYFTDPCVHLAGRLLDGTRYDFKLVQKTQNRSKWKTNPRGKRKYKSKVKAGSELTLALKFNPAKYPLGDEILGAVEKNLQLPPVFRVKALQAEEGAMNLCVCQASPSSTSKLDQNKVTECAAAMLLGLYQPLNLARLIKKNQSGGEA